MLYRPISDLHREFDRWYYQKCMKNTRELWRIYEPTYLDTDKDTVLGIAGDIDTKKYTVEFLLEMSNRFKAVVCVLGNHDYWKRDFSSHTTSIKKALSDNGINNVHLLDCDSVIIEDVRFIGATLWTDFNNANDLVMLMAKNSMNDYRYIRKENYSRRLTPVDVLKEHLKHRDFIFSYADSNEKMAVLSHHAPSWVSIDLHRYGDDATNSFYATELGNKISYSNFKLWHHGHTHSSYDYMIYNTRVICNPRGYFGDNLNEEYNDEFLIELQGKGLQKILSVLDICRSTR